MIAYLDTQVVTWLSQNKIARISVAAQHLIKSSDLLISPMVLLELEYLFEIGRTKLPADDVHLKLQYDTTIKVCDISFATIARLAVRESWTRDPFDRIIVANAKANGLAYLISSDESIAKHYQRTVW